MTGISSPQILHGKEARISIEITSHLKLKGQSKEVLAMYECEDKKNGRLGCFGVRFVAANC